MKFIFLMKICLFFFLASLHSYGLKASKSLSKLKVGQSLNTVEKFKFLFMLKWPTVKNERNNPLNVLTYKNVLLSTSQVVYFSSTNPLSSHPDESWNTSQYIFTMRYAYLDLPCLNRSYICTHSQFIKEYRPIYPELNYGVPSEILERFIDPQKASNNCLLIFLTPPINVADAAWLCHDDLAIVHKFQAKLSRIIREANGNSYDFMAEYIREKSEKINGIVTLTNSEVQFKDLSGKLNLAVNYDSIIPYAISLYLKEDIVWTGGKFDKPEEARCLKIQRKGEEFINLPDYFCIYFHRNDIKMKVSLNVLQARFQAEMYTNKVNIRLQTKSLNKSLLLLNKSQETIEVDSNVLSPIKNQVRIDYFISRHELLFNLRTNKFTRDEFEKEIKKSKEKIVNSVCSGIQVCKKAIDLSLNNGLLPLKGYREKFAMDVQNPFNSLAPKSTIKITLPNGGGISAKLLEQVKDLISSKEKRDLMSDPIPDSAPGEIPNVTTIKKAFNSFVALRDISKKYARIEQLGQNCRLNIRNNSNNLKRKIALLSFEGTHDTFFEYLGRIRNKQVNSKKYGR